MSRNVVFVAIALVLGALSTEFADDWSTWGAFAQLWFMTLAPAVLDVVPSALGWVVATAVYATQYLAVCGIAISAWDLIGATTRSLSLRA